MRSSSEALASSATEALLCNLACGRTLSGYKVSVPRLATICRPSLFKINYPPKLRNTVLASCDSLNSLQKYRRALAPSMNERSDSTQHHDSMIWLSDSRLRALFQIKISLLNSALFERSRECFSSSAYALRRPKISELAIEFESFKLKNSSNQLDCLSKSN